MLYLLEYDELNELLGGLATKLAIRHIVRSPVRKMNADNKAAKTLMKQDYKALKNINK